MSASIFKAAQLREYYVGRTVSKLQQLIDFTRNMIFGSGLSFVISLPNKIWYIFFTLFYGILSIINEFVQRHRIFDATNPKESRMKELAVVTGGGRGIGRQVVKKLLQANMDVIIGCRNPKIGHEMLTQFREEDVTSGTLETFTLDLLSLVSVREFAQKILDKKRPVNALVNNAGIMFSPFEITVDGFESQFQVNYLSHFLLTHLLMPRLKEAGTPELSSRIVNVSSSAHYGVGSIDFSDLHIVSKDQYNPYKAFCVSKFIQVASSNFWNTKLKDEGSPVIVNSLNPGIVATELYDQLIYTQVLATIIRFVFKNVEQGADTVTYAAISSELENKGGIFLANSQPCTPNSLSFDLNIQKKLWDLSCELLNIQN